MTCFKCLHQDQSLSHARFGGDRQGLGGPGGGRGRGQQCRPGTMQEPSRCLELELGFPQEREAHRRGDKRGGRSAGQDPESPRRRGEGRLCVQGLLLKPQFPSPGWLGGGRRDWGELWPPLRLSQTSSAFFVSTGSPCPGRQGTGGPAREADRHDMGTKRHHPRSTARGRGAPEGWAQQARK